MPIADRCANPCSLSPPPAALACVAYDAIGNPLTYRDGMSMTWSGRNLTGLTKDGQSISYTYDANGQRASKTVDGNTTTYYTSGGVKIGEYRAGTNTDVFYMHDEKGTIYGICINGTTYLFVYNAQGDVIALYDNAGNVHARYTYDPWGRPISITDGGGNDVSGNPSHIANINPFRYRNYYYDAETGLYYLNSRYYDPETKRFLNADGILDTGVIQSLNLFAYCHNNPIIYSDHTGTSPEFLDFMITYVQDCILRKRPNPNGLNITNLVRVVTDQLGRTGSTPYKTNSFAKEFERQVYHFTYYFYSFSGAFLFTASSHLGIEYEYYDVLVSSNSEKINGLMQWVDNQQKQQADADARGRRIIVNGVAGAVIGTIGGAVKGGPAGAVAGGITGFLDSMLKSLIIEIFG